MNKQVLLIDDDAEVRNTISENLRYAGYEVVEATNGDIGLIILAKIGFPGTIITDIIMPGKGGLETIKNIRAVNQDVKIIAMSGSAEIGGIDLLEMAEKAGADISFRKPLNLDALEIFIRA